MKTMPAAEYHSIKHPVISNSGLTQLSKSPAHYMAWLAQPQEPTSAMVLGSATHTLLFEPDLFAQEYVVSDATDRRTKGYKDLVAANPDKEVLTADEMSAIKGMVTSCKSHPSIIPLLTGGKVEQSIFWQDKETGVSCKARLDLFNPTHGVVVDLKTTQDASKSTFARDVANRRYHAQAAMYLNAVHADTGEAPAHFVFIAVEKEYPYAVGVYRASPDMLAAGQKLIQQDLKTFAGCLEANSWPGYPEMSDLSLPAWAL